MAQPHTNIGQYDRTRLSSWCCQSLRGVAMKPFYFKIPAAQVFEVVYADNLDDAKIRIFNEWSSLWHEIEWVTPANHQNVQLPNV